MPSINELAVLSAAVVSMVLGAWWYSGALFGNKWLAWIGKTKEQMVAEGKGTMGKTYGLAFIMALITAYVLAYFADFVGAVTFVAGAELGFWTWLGFVVTTNSAPVLYEGKRKEIYILYMGYQLVAFILMGGIVAWWQ